MSAKLCDTAVGLLPSPTAVRTFFVVFLLLGAACMEPPLLGQVSSGSTAHPLEGLHWLVGDWQGPFAGGTFFESWTLNDDEELEGRGLLVVDGDTVETEKLSIRLIHGHLSYITKVNDNIPVLFVFSADDSGFSRWAFINSEHDFPQRVVYERQNDSALAVYVTGRIRGTEKVLKYRLEKLPQTK